MKYALKNFAFKASLALNAVVLVAGLIGFAAVHSNAAEGYVKVSANFGKTTVDKVEVTAPNSDIAMQTMPIPQRKPKVP
jgi:hypothetical protein